MSSMYKKANRPPRLNFTHISRHFNLFAILTILLAQNGVASAVATLSREDWSARPPVKPANPLPTPLSLVIIAHSAHENCIETDDCKSKMRDIQNLHMDKNGWNDIGYNFAVGGDCSAYEGRGWKSEGAHALGYNKKSIGVGFIGTFNDIQPPDCQIKAALDLIEEGVNLNYLTKDHKVIGHRQVQKTLSPGDELYKIMTNWDHWSENP